MNFNQITSGLNSCVSEIEGKTKTLAKSTVDSSIKTAIYQGRQIKDVTAKVASMIGAHLKEIFNNPLVWGYLGAAITIVGVSLMFLGVVTANGIPCLPGLGLAMLGTGILYASMFASPSSFKELKFNNLVS